MQKLTLNYIAERFSNVSFNEDNYFVGGGLDNCKFASKRHEDAKFDVGKLTLGKCTQLFKRATNLSTPTIKDFLLFCYPNLEWHHAGRLPKKYGGGMKKTFFVNSTQISDIAKNWDIFFSNYETSKEKKRLDCDNKRVVDNLKSEYLNKYAKRVERVMERPPLFVLIVSEMYGKYGWFDSYNKDYKLTEYYTGWQFDNVLMYNEFLNIK